MAESVPERALQVKDIAHDDGVLCLVHLCSECDEDHECDCDKKRCEQCGVWLCTSCYLYCDDDGCYWCPDHGEIGVNPRKYEAMKAVLEAALATAGGSKWNTEAAAMKLCPAVEAWEKAAYRV